MDYECTVKADGEEYLAQFRMDEYDQANLVTVEGMTRETATHMMGWTTIMDFEEQAGDAWEFGGKADALMAEREFRHDMACDAADDARLVARDCE